MALKNKFKVAMFDDFLESLAKIPRKQQNKVRKFIRLFRENPTAASINYESIKSFKDPSLRTVRIDQKYRAVISKPESGNVYILLWVANHDEAMDWAKNKQMSVHPETGALQLLAGEYIQLPTKPSAQPGIFDEFTDAELLQLSVPQAMLPRVRALSDEAALQALAKELPEEAYEGLFWLSEGESLEDVKEAMSIEAPGEVDTSDFERAIDRDVSKRRFVTVEDDAQLEEMLDAPLEKWRVFLHPSQRKLVYRDWGGPVRVLGGAGTGKTVVAMHRAAYLAEKVYNQPGDHLLFTTFTKNLAADIRENLRKLCGPDANRRIEVVHLDKFVVDLLKGAGYPYKISYWGPERQTLKELWNEALILGATGLPFAESFYRDEWELVAQANGCDTEEEYLKASRAGRGQRLGRKQKRQVWRVFEAYRDLLERHSLREPEDALRDAAAMVAGEKARGNYRAVIVDEAQDMSTNAFILLRKLVPEGHNDLFIVGDGHQRIYRKRVVLGRAGINIRGRGQRLRVNYRTTDQLRRFAVALLEGVSVYDLDDELDTTRGYTSLVRGEAPEVKVTKTQAEELAVIKEWIGDAPEDACLMARTNKLCDAYEAGLRRLGLKLRRLRTSQADDARQPGLRIATMHRVKGLEFDRVVLAGLTEENMPWTYATRRSEDQAVQKEAEDMERALFYVAVTRAKRAALLTAAGTPSRLIRRP